MTNLPESLVLESLLDKRCTPHEKDPEPDQIWAEKDDWAETIQILTPFM